MGAAGVPPGPPSSTANLKRQVSAQRNPANAAPRHGWGFTHLEQFDADPVSFASGSDLGRGRGAHIIGLPGNGRRGRKPEPRWLWETN
jgi:hypothetical protein